MFYKVGEGRAVITEDKVSDENARLLTMAAVAEELKAGEVREASIILAVGLPFSDFGREKRRLQIIISRSLRSDMSMRA